MINTHQAMMRMFTETSHYQGSKRSKSPLDLPLATLATSIARRFARKNAHGALPNNGISYRITVAQP